MVSVLLISAAATCLCVLKEFIMWSIFVSCSSNKKKQMLPNHRSPCQYGCTCLPFAKVWIPWHHQPRTDPIAPGGKLSWPVNSTSKNTPTCKTRLRPSVPPAGSWPTVTGDEPEKEIRSICHMLLHGSHKVFQARPFWVPFICLWMGSGHNFLSYTFLVFFFFFRTIICFPSFCSILSKMPLSDQTKSAKP